MPSLRYVPSPLSSLLCATALRRISTPLLWSVTRISHLSLLLFSCSFVLLLCRCPALIFLCLSSALSFLFECSFLFLLSISFFSNSQFSILFFRAPGHSPISPSISVTLLLFLPVLPFFLYCTYTANFRLPILSMSFSARSFSTLPLF